MRRAAKVDGNQQAIVRALRAAGCAVQSLAAVGDGCPDLLVSLRGHLYLLECKDPVQAASKQRLRESQKAWMQRWRSRVHVVRTPEEALTVVGARVVAGPVIRSAEWKPVQD
jgi:hypothetical protein